ncbi:MAG: DUF4062 domain-containing protein [Desulfobacterales bacterium]|nr:DUF4062 domain-containing protein [Desulfobacterales bacterium]
MNKKYQVFVSSTYEDLRKERQEVMNALLELDCIPSGMELFPAADEDQWSLIQGVIDECDYYILILGARYGSISPDGIGYTEMEYNYALETRKPIIAFLHKDPDSLPKKLTEQTEEGQKKFQEFRDKVKSKMCKFWESPEELGSVVSRSLIMLQRKHPGIGWVRGDLIPSQEASQEILKLKKEIENLESRLNEARTQAPPGTEDFAQKEDIFTVHFACKSIFDYETYNWQYNFSTSWDNIFYHVSPIMINEATDTDLRASLNRFVNKYGLPQLLEANKDETFEHRFKPPTIIDDDFQTIKVQLRALGLMVQSNKPRSIKDTGTYWTLTPYGDSVMNKLRAIKKVG